MKKLCTILMVILFFSDAQAQSVGIGTVSPDPSAMLHINSISKGLLIPKMNYEQRDGIPNPAKGLLVFVNVDSSFYYFTGATWVKLLTGNGKTAWELTGNTNATGKFIGTLDTSAFRIFTNNSEKVTVAANGFVGIGTNTPLAKLHTVDGLLVSGTFDAGDTIKASGSGTRLFFNNRKSAFRAGRVDGNQWDNINVGQHSTATGFNTTASGFASTVFGWGSISSSSFSSANGYYANASNEYSNAIGTFVSASGYVSNAIGFYAHAAGEQSIAIGTGVLASGKNATSTGLNNLARSFAETVVGANNTDYTPDSLTSWGVKDRLFVIGNGVDGNKRSNAVTVFKNGKVGIGTTKMDYPGWPSLNKMVLASDDTENIDFIHSYANNSNGYIPGYGFARAAGSLAAPAIVTTNMYQGGIYSTGYDGTSYVGSTAIFFTTDGTPGVNNMPGKIDFLTSPAGSGNPLTRMTIKNTGNVGIGTAAPVGRLHVLSTDFANTILQGTSTAGTWLSVGNTTPGGKWFNMISTGSGNGEGAGKFLFGRGVGATGINGYIMTFDSLLHVGINTPNPHATLQLGNATENRRIVLWEDADNNHQYYGFGINNSTLRYQTGGVNADHVFFAGTSATASNELMRVKGNGNVGIGTSGPGGKFEVNMDSTRFVLTNFTPGLNTALMANFIGKGASLGPQARFTTQTGPTFYDIGMNGTQGFTIEENDNPRLTVLQGGNIGIGTTNPGYKLDVAAATIAVNATTTGTLDAHHAIQGVGTGGIGWVGNNYSGVWAKGTAAGTYGLYSEAGAGGISIYCVGNGQYTGTWTLASDTKFKKDYVGINNAVDKIKQLNPTTYLLKTDEYSLMNFPTERQFGFVAQEIEKVFPTLVELGKNPGNKDVAPFEYKSVNYIGMIPVLTKAIQEQQAQIEKQQAQNEKQQAQIEKQQAQIAELLKRFETISK